MSMRGCAEGLVEGLRECREAMGCFFAEDACTVRRVDEELERKGSALADAFRSFDEHASVRDARFGREAAVRARFAATTPAPRKRHAGKSGAAKRPATRSDRSDRPTRRACPGRMSRLCEIAREGVASGAAFARSVNPVRPAHTPLPAWVLRCSSPEVVAIRGGRLLPSSVPNVRDSRPTGGRVA